jgi:hypothetical protein
MDLREFNSLDLIRQAERTWEEGILEGHWNKGHLHYVLYKLKSFFVEIAFDTNTDEVVQVKSFKYD